ncbi:hypothetical protein [Rhizobium halophytocola]|uniref:Uncharacterized protein n=1 Tax=Rhizobium halophytocola TaxID=735519 RepID=A0ABS4E0A4_9HYPH|nr:hypothetical protein [Rhizobium halophytocola]MBP1851370.1 hypothetical protein [Rhizobium halophytocola]
MVKSKKRDERAEPVLFYPMDVLPPSAATCRAALYDAFADYRAALHVCPTCFGEDNQEELRLTARQPVERANYAVIRQFLFEHPNCCDGLDSIRHWLPRLLEAGFFDTDAFPSPIAQVYRSGLWLWPEQEQAAIRAAVRRAAEGWFRGGSPAPFDEPAALRLSLARHRRGLQRDARKADAIAEAERPLGLHEENACSRFSVQSLLLTRFEPRAVFDWLLQCGSRRAIAVIVEMLEESSLGDDIVYYSTPFGPAGAEEIEQALADATSALNRLVRHALFEVVTDERLLALYETVCQSDPGLAETLCRAEYAWGIGAYEAWLTDPGAEIARLRHLLRIAGQGKALSFGGTSSP